MSGPKESDIVLDTPGYECVCVICGKDTGGDNSGEFETKIRTFSLGMSADNAFCSGVMFLCPEHKSDDNAMLFLLGRIRFIAEAYKE